MDHCEWLFKNFSTRIPTSTKLFFSYSSITRGTLKNLFGARHPPKIYQKIRSDLLNQEKRVYPYLRSLWLQKKLEPPARTQYRQLTDLFINPPAPVMHISTFICDAVMFLRMFQTQLQDGSSLTFS